VTAGGEYFEDRARTGRRLDDNPNTDNLFSGGKESIHSYNAAGYFEVVARTPWAVVTAGGRGETNNRFGSVFVPRLGLTRAWERLHLKAIYSEAYRAPNLMNVDLNPNILPERTRAVEGEAGWLWSEGSLTSLNVFDQMIRHPIVYDASGAGDETYTNYPRIGTRGAEVVHTWKGRQGAFFSLSYARYIAQENAVPLYGVPGHNRVLLGAPAQSVSAQAVWRPADHWFLAPTLQYRGSFFAYDYDAVQGGMALKRFHPSVFADAALTREDLGVRGLAVAITVHNILNTSDPLPQPYNGGHPPLSGPSREWGIRLNYREGL
jgi:outer membrane cobalamin receptor